MSPIAPLIVVLGTLGTGTATPSEGTGSDGIPQPTAEPDLWQRSIETAADWWRESRAFADRAIADAKQLFDEDRDFVRVWETVVPTLDSALILEEQHDALPPKAWIGTDQRSNQEAIDALLDEAVDILATSPVQGVRERIRALQAEIEQDRAAIAEARQRRITAPMESTLQRTVADYDRSIETLEQDIARLNEARAAVKRELATELRRIGLELDDGQIDLLLTTVVGDHLVDLGVVFDNVKAITVQLEGLVAASGEDLQSARRYYGLYVVLLQTLSRMQRQIEEAIGEDYVPRIDAIIARTHALSGETRRLQREAPERRDLLAANLAAQQLTVEAAAMYRRYLEDQATRVQQARHALDRDIAAAWNTYETVRVSGELVTLVQSSRALLDGLLTRQVPSLRPFENLEMQREFGQLTEQLRMRGSE